MANYSVSDKKEPDKIIIMKYGGTTYEVQEFYNGTKTVDDIVIQRIIQESQNAAPSPPPTDILAVNAELT